MTNRIARRLNAAGRLLSAIAGMPSVTCPIVFLADAIDLRAQSQAGGRPEFEVATVKQSPPLTGDLININLGTVRNGKLTLTNATLSDCLKFAYGIVSDAQISGPDWIKSKVVRFDVVARSADTDRDQLRLMLQTLLADRLKLVLHREQKELPFLALRVGKNGPKLHEAKADAATAGGPMVLGHIASNRMSMAALASLLSRFERQTIVDMTGLNGFFEVGLEWARDSSRPVPPLGDAAGVLEQADSRSGPTIFAAVQEQLGLKLESRKGPLDVLVVDHAEKIPSEN